MNYALPENLEQDISQLGELIQEYKDKKIGTDEFKASRVPMGIYEQRIDEVYMSRIRTTGGVITPKQLLDVIQIAQTHKSDLVHITTRQEIQIQNLQIENVESSLQELRKIGLATKGGGGNTIRNILVSEFSGISASEYFDVTPHAMAITSKLIAEADSYLMPRKVKTAFASDDKEIGHAAINDIGFVAQIKDGVRGFRVYVGGGAGAKPTVGWILFDFLPETKLHALNAAVKKFFSDHGNRKNKNRARLRFVFYQLGEEETLRLIKEYYKETEQTEPEFKLEETDNQPAPYRYKVAQLTIDNDAYNFWKKRYVNQQKQSGYNTILLPILLGNIFVDDIPFVNGMKNLLKFIQQFGDDTIRFTTYQSIRLRNIPDEALPELFSLINKFIPDASEPVVINNLTSCTGADTCRLGIGLSKGLARATRKQLLASNTDLSKLDDARIHISGCPNSCGMQLWGDIGFSGKVLRNNDRTYPGYQVYLGANRYENPKLAEVVGTISAKDAPVFINRLFDDYLKNISKYNSFSAYISTQGKDFAIQLLEEYKTVPTYEENKDYYTDWGAETTFGVIVRGKAECAAGIFDMLKIDCDIINTSKNLLQKETDPTKRNRLLYDIVFSSSRLLLATRGSEPKTTKDIFNSFIKNIIDFGFVEDKFKGIVETARDNKNADLDAEQPLIYELSDKVVAIYKSLDDSLQLKDPKK